MWSIVRACLIAGLVAFNGDTLSAASPSAAPPSAAPEWRFSAVDVLVDPLGRDLAAYQIEVDAESDDLQIVGVEGGEHASFREPPYYDAAALGGGRIIIAAFSTSEQLPDVRSRVATLHVRWRAEAPLSKLHVDVQAAATTDGSPIKIAVELVAAHGGSR